MLQVAATDPSSGATLDTVLVELHGVGKELGACGPAAHLTWLPGPEIDQDDGISYACAALGVRNERRRLCCV